MKQGYLTMLSVGKYGRLANGMYQIAGILGIARKNNLEPVFPEWKNHDGRNFETEIDIDVQRHFVNELPRVPEGVEWQPERPQHWGYRDINLPPGNWNISGHFQSARYFNHCLDTVQHYFRMKDEPPVNDYVGIHVRLQDYNNEAGWHPRMTMDYYAPAMALFPGAKFLVFSDDIPACKQMFGASAEYSEQDYIQDFKLLKRCKSFIIGNSSYSAMAAILGEHPEKRVVAPRPWFGPAAGINGEDIYGTDWTVINWEHEREAAA